MLKVFKISSLHLKILSLSFLYLDCGAGDNNPQPCTPEGYGGGSTFYNPATGEYSAVGDTSVEPVIRKGLAIGADEAIRIDTVPKDSYSTAKEIAAYLIKNPVDLIIAGK